MEDDLGHDADADAMRSGEAGAGMDLGYGDEPLEPKFEDGARLVLGVLKKSCVILLIDCLR